MLRPAKKNLKGYQGATFRYPFSVRRADGTLQDFTGAVVESQLRDDTGTVAETFAGSVSADGTVVQILLTALQTAALDPEATYDYDVRVTFPSGDVAYYLAGTFTIGARVTA